MNLGSHQLFRAGREIHLQQQPLRLLLLLIERPGDLRTREELREQLWRDGTFVEFDDGLNTAIQKIRQVLGDDARNPRFVETVPRQGYRFIAPVQFDSPFSPPAAEHAEHILAPVEASEALAAKPARARHLGWLAAICIAAIAGVAVGWIIHYNPFSDSPTSPMRLSITLPPNVELRPGIRGGSAISPDGRSLVFAGRRDGKHQLWIRHLDAFDASPLAGTEDGILPFWSPDGKSIGFQSAGKIRRIDVAGGPPIELATATRPTRGGWTQNDAILFAAGAGGPIQRIRATGGSLKPVTPDRPGGATWPYAIPGSDRFLFFDNPNRRVQIASLSGDFKPIPLFASDTNAVYAPPFKGYPGQLLWLKGTTLMAQAFDPKSATLSGDAAAVADGVGFADRSRMVDLSVSANGLLLYGPGNMAQSRLAWIRRDGTIAEYVGEQGWLRSVRLSVDGRRALIERDLPRTLWIYDFDRNVLSRATFHQEGSGWPVWSPDGLEIAYSGERNGHVGLYRLSAKGGQPEMKLADSAFDDFLYDWARDGRHLIYCEVNPETKLDLWMLPLSGDRKPQPFLRTPFNEDSPQFSPDGRWVAYVSDESGRNEVYVTSFPRAEGKWQVSTGGGSMPRWASNNEIFYESAAGHIVAVKTRSGAREFEWSTPRRLFPTPMPGRSYDVSPQGDRLLMMTPVEGRSRNELTVIVNWQAALRR